MSNAKPEVVDDATWRSALDELRKREKAATRELDAIAAQRRRLPMVELPDYTLIGANGPVRPVDLFEGAGLMGPASFHQRQIGMSLHQPSTRIRRNPGRDRCVRATGPRQSAGFGPGARSAPRRRGGRP